MQNIGANLRAPFNFLFIAFDGLPGFVAFSDLQFIKLGTQHLHGSFTVGGLTPFHLASDHDPGWLVGQHDFGFDLVDILAPGPSGTRCLHFNFRRMDVDLDAIVNDGVGINRGKGGMSTGVGIVGRNAHQAMHPVLALEVTVGKVTCYFEGHGFDTGLFAILTVQFLNAVSMTFGPHPVHAFQHRSPILAFGSTGS